MAPSPPHLTVNYTRTARLDLGDIWDWNAREYGPDHASDYVAYLEQQIDYLSTRHGEGKPMDMRPELIQIVFRRSRNPKAHAHVAIYRVDELAGTVTVLHVFHTRQDIQGRIEKESS